MGNSELQTKFDTKNRTKTNKTKHTKQKTKQSVPNTTMVLSSNPEWRGELDTTLCDKPCQ